MKSEKLIILIAVNAFTVNFAFRIHLMNDSSKHIGRGYLLFKRWSNQSFAVFNSLRKVVHIGFILPIVSNLITVKAQIVRIVDEIFVYLNESEFDEGEPSKDRSALLNLTFVIGLPKTNLIIPADRLCSSEEFALKSYISNSQSRPFSGLFYFIYFSDEDRRRSLFSSSISHKPLFSHEPI